MQHPYLSIVIPVYNESSTLELLYERLTKALDAMGKSFEIVFTNDGSKDNSFDILKEFHQRRPQQIRVVNFNGNFGQHMAIMAGFAHSRGELVITLDADLQNPPEEIHKLVEKYSQGFDLIEGVRQLRQDSWFRVYASRLNNIIREKITKISINDQGSMLRGYSRRIVDLVVSSDEASVYIPALAYTFATNPCSIPIAHEPRAAGTSKYNLYRLLRLNFDLMTGYSLVPLQFFSFFGIAISILSFLFFIFMLLRRIIVGSEAQGVFTLFAILFFLIGIVLFGLGVMGEYVGRILQQVRKRPHYVIREIIETDDKK